MQALDLVRKNFQNSENFGNSFIKNGIIYVNLPLTYESSIILSLLKINTLKLTMYILTILTYSLKLHNIGKEIFYNPDFFKSDF